VTELGELRKSYGEIAERGVEVVAVSVDPPEVSERLRRRLGLEIRFLSDPDGTLMDPLHIRHRGGRPGFLPPAEGAARADIFLPTTFLLDGDGVIRWIYRPDTYRVRASPREVLAAIDAARTAR
jgi:peroxiredoxin